jgi:hypothetical protein
MATKPAALPTWPTAGTRTSPGGSAAAGFVAGNRFPAEWANYLFGWLSDWAAYVSASFRTDGAGVRYTDRVTRISPAAMQILGTPGTDWGFTIAGAHANAAGGCQWVATGGNKDLVIPLTVSVGDRIKAVSVDLNPLGAMSMALWDSTDAGFTNAQIGTTQFSGAGPQTLSITGLSTVAQAGHSYHMVVTSTTNLESVRGASQTIDCVT